MWLIMRGALTEKVRKVHQIVLPAVDDADCDGHL